MSKNRELTQIEYYAALGLFHLANTKAREVAKLEDQLHELLGLESGSHVSDAIYEKDPNIDLALEREGIKLPASSPGKSD